MDPHFVKPAIPKKRIPPDYKKLIKILKSFLPVFVLAAMLPFLIGTVLVPQEINFFTKADSKDQLRIWLDPPEIVMSKGSETTLSVYANFESDNRLVPEIVLEADTGKLLSINNPKVKYPTPFKGRREIGKISVVALDSGVETVGILKDSIALTSLDTPVEIITGSAKITIR